MKNRIVLISLVSLFFAESCGHPRTQRKPGGERPSVALHEGAEGKGSAQQSGIELFTEDSFERLIDFRVGTGENRFFYTFGDVRTQPGGEVLYQYEGVEIATLAPGSRSSTEATQLSRRIFFYVDPKTGTYIRENAGQAVPPVKYDYIIMEWKLQPEGNVTIHGTQGVKPRILTLDVDVPNVRRLSGDVLMFPVNHFFSSGNYFFHEFGSYLSFPDASSQRIGHFVRLQPMPAWTGQSSTQAMLDLTIEDVGSFEALPERLRKVIGEEFPRFNKPPATLAECEEIQNGTAQ